MCFDLDSRPPIAPIAGGALDSEVVTLTAADGNRLAAFKARAAEPTGAGIVILPDVRGLHPFYEELALRFAERGIDAVAIDWFGRTAATEPRGEDFDYMPHASATTWAGISADIAAGVAGVRAADRRPGRGIGRLHDRVLHGRADVVPGAARSASAWPASSGSTARSWVRGETTHRRRSMSPPRSRHPSSGSSAARTR